jgi:hypothetical protein
VARVFGQTGPRGIARTLHILDACIRLQGLSYEPHWLGGATATGEQVSPAHSFFHLAWKWLLLCHSQDTLSELSSVAQMLEASRTPDAIRSQRLIALAATRILITNRLADRIVSHPTEGGLLSSGDEMDRVMDQLGAMKDSSCWVEPTAGVCSLFKEG